MLDRFLHLFELDTGPPGPPPPARSRVAAAALLVEAARADGSFGRAERQRIERLLRLQFELEPEEADALLQAAEEAAEEEEVWAAQDRAAPGATQPPSARARPLAAISTGFAARRRCARTPSPSVSAAE